MIMSLTTGDLFVELLINNWDIAQVTRILESMVSLSSSLRTLDESSSRTANRVSNEFDTDSVRQVDGNEPGNGFCDSRFAFYNLVCFVLGKVL